MNMLGINWIRTIANQLTLPNSPERTCEWHRADESKDGPCLVQGNGSRVFMHARLPRGSILFPAEANGKPSLPGVIIFPTTRIAVFKFGK